MAVQVICAAAGQVLDRTTGLTGFVQSFFISFYPVIPSK
jgi:hypothetical protein